MPQLVNQRQPTFFSKWELWYHLAMMLTLVPVCNAYFIGSTYFSNWRIFLAASVLLCLLYLLAATTIAVVVRWVINRYPGVQHSTQRTLTILVVLSVLSSISVVLDVLVYSMIPPFDTAFTWVVIRPVLFLSLVFDFIFGTSLSLFYSYRQWHNDQAENEQLRQATYQHQLDTLKMQINPHFLFNSLTSLSSLIGEDRRKASQFVDELSKVYRYLLQGTTRELVSLQTELDFITAYGNLLQTRYGNSLKIEHNIQAEYLEYSLPTQSLQILVDNAIKHNVMTAGNPLRICIRTTADGKLLVQNTLQRKVNKVEYAKARLVELTTKYRRAGADEVRIDETDSHFGVLLPLLAHVRLTVS